MGMLYNPAQPLLRHEVVDAATGEVIAFYEQRFESGEPSLAQQQFVEECDINNIIAKYKVSGLVPGSANQPMYGDFSALPSYQEAMDSINRGNEIFGSLSAEVRARFENDPAQFLEWAKDPANVEDLRKWNLVPPAEVKSATLDDVVTELRAAKPPAEPPEGGVTK